ncbi:MAG: hypothetical protein NC432_05035 [Roseburia sp.]|nr:hypothetical protein [Roseburia sp.]MCM1098528.1 hypothetical protein [Ruminococcus flavefaciens]
MRKNKGIFIVTVLLTLSMLLGACGNVTAESIELDSEEAAAEQSDVSVEGNVESEDQTADEVASDSARSLEAEAEESDKAAESETAEASEAEEAVESQEEIEETKEAAEDSEASAEPAAKTASKSKTESKTAESKTTESKKTESKTTESKTTESKTTESKAAESETTESKTTEPAAAPAPASTPASSGPDPNCDHDWAYVDQVDEINKNNCTARSYLIVRCTKCGIDSTMSDTGWVESHAWYKPAGVIYGTCTTVGDQWWVCEWCGKESHMEMPINKDNHEGFVETSREVIQQGCGRFQTVYDITYTCTGCGATKTDDEYVVDGTCYDNDNDGYYDCCGYQYREISSEPREITQEEYEARLAAQAAQQGNDGQNE